MTMMMMKILVYDMCIYLYVRTTMFFASSLSADFNFSRIVSSIHAWWDKYSSDNENYSNHVPNKSQSKLIFSIFPFASRWHKFSLSFSSRKPLAQQLYCTSHPWHLVLIQSRRKNFHLNCHQSHIVGEKFNFQHPVPKVLLDCTKLTNSFRLKYCL